MKNLVLSSVAVALLSTVNYASEISHTVNFGYTGTTGNSKTLNVTGKYDMALKTIGISNKELNVKFDASAFYSESQEVKDNEEYATNLNLEQFIFDKWLSYASLNWLTNEFKNFDSKLVIGVGLGREMFNRPNSSLKIKLGLAQSLESYTDGSSDQDFTSLTQAIEYEYRFNKVSKFFAKMAFLEAIDDFSNNYEGTGTIGFNFQIAKKVTLNIEEEIRYDNLVVGAGTKEVDTKTIIKVGYTF